MNSRAIYLTQTDTTAGFLSEDSLALARLKGRPEGKPILLAVDSLRELASFVRVPVAFKKLVRRAEKSSFIYPNNIGIRVVKSKRHGQFLTRFRRLYTTSSNPSGAHFDMDFAYKMCDVVVVDEMGIVEGKASQIWKLGRLKRKKIRG
ncbi:MAG: Sua5/YciO/YrdC/YwlC family protein [Wolinella sp.]